MSVKKITNNLSKEIRWEVRVYENGRGSKRICKRFDKRSEAEVWLLEFEKNQAEKVRNPFSSISFENRFFSDEADYPPVSG